MSLFGRSILSTIRALQIPPLLLATGHRAISSSPNVFRNVKEVRTSEKDGVTTIEGIDVSSPRTQYVIQYPETSCECPLCRFGVQVKHTDVLIIQQFIDSYGKLIPRDVTGLCYNSHRKMRYLVVMAEKAGLITKRNRITGEKRELVGWEKLNKYYDESIIVEFLQKRRHKC